MRNARICMIEIDDCAQKRPVALFELTRSMGRSLAKLTPAQKSQKLYERLESIRSFSLPAKALLVGLALVPVAWLVPAAAAFLFPHPASLFRQGDLVSTPLGVGMVLKLNEQGDRLNVKLRGSGKNVWAVAKDAVKAAPDPAARQTPKPPKVETHKAHRADPVDELKAGKAKVDEMRAELARLKAKQAELRQAVLEQAAPQSRSSLKAAAVLEQAERAAAVLEQAVLKRAEPQGGCRNEHENCARWANEGECERNAVRCCRPTRTPTPTT